MDATSLNPANTPDAIPQAAVRKPPPASPGSATRKVRIEDKIAGIVIRVGGSACLVILLLIFLFLVREAVPFAREYSPARFFTGTQWYPTSEPPIFGLVPLLVGSLLVTLTGVAIAVPFGIAGAAFLAELAPAGLRAWLKPIVELLAGIPSVVFGFIGMLLIGPWIKDLFKLPTGLSALTGGVMLALISLPTVITIAEDALNAVPRSFKEASLAMGATRWQTLVRVAIPSASSGLIAAAMLGVGRAIGETMTVMMVTGNAGVITGNVLSPVRTMTATIASEMGETVQGGDHYHSLFTIGLVLFAISFLVNLVSDIALQRVRSQRAR
jgi:phosphate transport system permease protein